MTLTREEGRGLGFTVAGGANTTGGCYIKAVLQNPALSDGRLKSGDKLIMVCFLAYFAWIALSSKLL